MRYCFAILILAVVGCRDLPKAASGAPPAAQPIPGVLSPRPLDASQGADRALPETPRAVGERIRTWRLERRYDEIEDWVVPERRGELTRLLTAVDRMLDANGRLQAAAVPRFGSTEAERVDLSVVRNNLGLLSADVQIVGEQNFYDRAELILQEGDTLPLVRCRFEHRGNFWRLVPEDIEADLPVNLARVATHLSQLASQVERDELTATQLLAAFARDVIPLIESLQPGNAAHR